MDTSLSPEQRPKRLPTTTETGNIEQEEKFFPSGAIAFFIALVILCLVIWFGIYFLMIERI
jgi:hypothetical protein